MLFGEHNDMDIPPPFFLFLNRAKKAMPNRLRPHPYSSLVRATRHGQRLAVMLSCIITLVIRSMIRQVCR